MKNLSLPDLINSSLKNFIIDGGGCDDFLFNGPKVTKQIEVKMDFRDFGYSFTLTPTADEIFAVHREKIYNANYNEDNSPPNLSGPNFIITTFRLIHQAIESWKIYHLNDTGKFASMRRSEIEDDCEYLRFDAANIAPFLLMLKENEEDIYQQIVETVKLVTPFFDDFILKPKKRDKVRLLWKQKGSDYPFEPYHLSDGTIRFICLVTALLQPELPSTIIIDEPELGLHPYAIDILAELIQAVSTKTQVLISTQSPALVDSFDPKDIVVVNRKDGASTFERLNTEELAGWLEEYSLGELWRKNVVTGGPVHE